MELGMVGLGKMGANMTERLLRASHRVVATDLNPEAIEKVEAVGAVGAANLDLLIKELEAPRVVWLMVPSGRATESSIELLLEKLEPGDVIVDGANSDWRDSVRRAEKAADHDLHFIDAGVSGGVWGLERGYNLMVGGSDEAFSRLEPALKSLAADGGYLHVGPAGSGHFVKMIHNGIEYALMQSYGEGFEALASFEHADLDLEKIAKLWQNGSVIRSWLLELVGSAFEKDARLEDIAGYVNDSGMGRWTVEYGIDNAIPMPAISAALFARFGSRQQDAFAAKVAAALRNEFGGHAVKSMET